MDTTLSFTESETRELDDALKGALPAGSPTSSVADLIGAWRSFVASVERGYDFTIYDYTNDLSARDLLASLSGRLSESLAGKLAQRLAPMDDRFLKATEAIRRSLPGAPGEAGVWWRRIPKRLGSELRTDLESEGIL